MPEPAPAGTRPPPGTAVPRPPLVARLRSYLGLGIVAALALVAYQSTNFNLASLFTGAADFFSFFGRLAPDWSALRIIWRPLIETMQIAYVGTVLGTSIALPLIFLASANTALDPISMVVARVILTILRSIPDLLWAALFVTLLAPGALPGIVALTFFTVGVLAKLGSETVESADPGPLEALRAAGAGRNRTIVFAVWPQVAATMTSYILYSFEINVRASVILGFVGAGGIGQLLYTRLNFFDYSGVGAIVAVTFVVVLFVDAVSVWARSKLI